MPVISSSVKVLAMAAVLLAAMASLPMQVLSLRCSVLMRYPCMYIL